MTGKDDLIAALSGAAEATGYSGVMLVEQDGEPLVDVVGGLADRAEGRPNQPDTKFATASGTKGFTAVTVVSVIEEGLLAFEAPLSSLVGDDLPNVDPAVTIEQLLGHTSGVGDYLDEDTLESSDDYVLDVPVHTLLGPDDYLPLLAVPEQVERPGSQFRYNNSGFVLLALAIERATGAPYHDEVRRRVFEPAGMTATDFLRSDRLPADTALGYLTDGRTNVLHLPVIGTGDGGAYTTAPDMIRFWDALLAGRLVAPPLVERMTTEHDRARIDLGDGRESYGLGFWIGADRTTVLLEGQDAGVSFRSGANRRSGFRFCLIANNASDVWPLARLVDRHLFDVS